MSTPREDCTSYNDVGCDAEHQYTPYGSLATTCTATPEDHSPYASYGAPIFADAEKPFDALYGGLGFHSYAGTDDGNMSVCSAPSEDGRSGVITPSHNKAIDPRYRKSYLVESRDGITGLICRVLPNILTKHILEYSDKTHISSCYDNNFFTLSL